MNAWFRSGIFRRNILSLLVISLLPLLVLGGLALQMGDAAGSEASAQSRNALDAKSADTLELRAEETANAIAHFLEGREADLRTLALLPRSVQVYAAFDKVHQARVWFLDQGQEATRMIPLYREIAYVDAAGQEVIKIADGQATPPDELRNVSDPANTLYRSETYFAEARQLPPGEIYISHVTGSYVSKVEFDAGKRYNGVLRFAMPVFDQRAGLEGIVVLALDIRCLAEFTEHIVPTSQRFAAAPDPATGSYAYLIDNQAYTVAHPTDYVQPGVDQDGRPLPFATRPEEIGTLPVRLDQIGFIDENLASIPGRAAKGEAGSIQYYWAGRNKFVAFAPIPYYGSSYDPPGGFGWVGIGAEVGTFHGAATAVDEAIQERVQTLGVVTLAVLAVAALVVLVVAGVLARQVSAPIRRVTEAAHAVERGDFRLGVLEPLLRRNSADEIGHLAHVFGKMAAEVQKREQYRHLLDVVISIGVTLPQEKDFNRLLETILLEAKAICDADAGSLYLRAENVLKFVIVRNDSLGIALGGTTGKEIAFPPVRLYDETGAPNHTNVASYTVHTGQTVNVADAYQSDGFDFSGTKAYDEHTGYRSTSFLSVPLKDNSQEVIGVLQLINARNPQTGKVAAFDAGMNRVIESLAALGTIALKAYLREAQLRQQVEQLRIEIDQSKRQQQVAEITETEYFQRLQQRARELRKRFAR